MKYAKIIKGSVFAVMMLVFAISALAAEPTELKGELLFTIPWGNDWGQIRYVAQEELSESTYDGPEAMVVMPGGYIYIYDGPQRLHKFSSDGKFQTGVQFSRDTEIKGLAIVRYKPPK